MAHTELDLRERRAIEDMLHATVPVSEIAANLGRHRSSIYREIKRNGFVDKKLPQLDGYYGVMAQRTATDRRARRQKLVRLEDLRTAVVAQLKEGWSPEQIAGRLGFEGQPVRVSWTAPIIVNSLPTARGQPGLRYMRSTPSLATLRRKLSQRVLRFQGCALLPTATLVRKQHVI